MLGAQIKDGQYQIIIGPNVNKVYDEVVPLLDDSAASVKPSSGGKAKGAQVLDIITGIFSAILPALVAGGMLKGLLALAEIFGVNTGTGTCQILSMISDVRFYFLPQIQGQRIPRHLHGWCSDVPHLCGGHRC